MDMDAAVSPWAWAERGDFQALLPAAKEDEHEEMQEEKSALGLGRKPGSGNPVPVVAP